jgi:hypothetical protein
VCCRAEATVVRCMVWYGVVWCGALRCGVVWCGVQADAVTPELNTTRYAAYWLRQVRWGGVPSGVGPVCLPWLLQCGKYATSVLCSSDRWLSQ